MNAEAFKIGKKGFYILGVSKSTDDVIDIPKIGDAFEAGFDYAIDWVEQTTGQTFVKGPYGTWPITHSKLSISEPDGRPWCLPSPFVKEGYQLYALRLQSKKKEFAGCFDSVYEMIDAMVSIVKEDGDISTKVLHFSYKHVISNNV